MHTSFQSVNQKCINKIRYQPSPQEVELILTIIENLIEQKESKKQQQNIQQNNIYPQYKISKFKLIRILQLVYFFKFGSVIPKTSSEVENTNQIYEFESSDEDSSQKNQTTIICCKICIRQRDVCFKLNEKQEQICLNCLTKKFIKLNIDPNQISDISISTNDFKLFVDENKLSIEKVDEIQQLLNKPFENHQVFQENDFYEIQLDRVPKEREKRTIFDEIELLNQFDQLKLRPVQCQKDDNYLQLIIRPIQLIKSPTQLIIKPVNCEELEKKQE